MNGEACNFYRNADGFCHLTNRCWAGKRCPKTQRQADNARDALVDEAAALARAQFEDQVIEVAA